MTRVLKTTQKSEIFTLFWHIYDNLWHFKRFQKGVPEGRRLVLMVFRVSSWPKEKIWAKEIRSSLSIFVRYGNAVHCTTKTQKVETLQISLEPVIKINQYYSYLSCIISIQYKEVPIVSDTLHSTKIPSWSFFGSFVFYPLYVQTLFNS